MTAVVFVETVLLLALAEGGLRVCGYGYTTHPFITKQYGGKEFHLLNDRYYNQFINLENWPQDYDFPGSTVVSGVKPPGTYRVFVFGGSAAYGWFFQDYSMGCMLETMLRKSYPDCRFEVITVAFHAMNSFTMRYLADACALMQPDLFLVYMGNNEMIGPYGFQSVLGRTCRSAATMECMVRANLWLSNVRLFQLCGVPAQKLFSKSVAHLRWGGYAGVTELNDPRLDRVCQGFRKNLDSICEAAARAGAQTALCTVGYNLRDRRPTTSAHRKPLSPEESTLWDGSYELGKDREGAQDYDQAIRAYERAAAIDDTHADLMYRLGGSYRAVANYPRARECFLKAVDNELSFCSANTRLNGIIGEVASSRSGVGVRLIDTAQALAAGSPDGIPGSEFFYDHVHLTFEGNYIIASEMFRHMGDLVRNRGDGGGGAEPAPPSMEQCMQWMGYSPGVRLRETQTALSVLKNDTCNPILPRLQSLQIQLEKQAGEDIDAAIAEGDRQALALDGDNMQLRGRYVECRKSLGRCAETLEDARLLVGHAPCNWRYRAALVCALMASDPREVLHQCHELLEIYPEYAGTHELAGNAALNAGETDEAVVRFSRAVALNSLSAPFHRGLGRSLAMKGEFRKAASCMRRAIALDAAQTDAAVSEIRTAVSVFRNAENWNKVAEGCKALLQVKPDQDDIRPQLVDALCELKDFEAARREVVECQKWSVAVSPELTDRLERESAHGL